MTADELKQIRKRLSLSRRELAAATGKGFSTVSCYEAGSRPIPEAFAKHVRLLAEKS